MAFEAEKIITKSENEERFNQLIEALALTNQALEGLMVSIAQSNLLATSWIEQDLSNMQDAIKCLVEIKEKDEGCNEKQKKALAMILRVVPNYDSITMFVKTVASWGLGRIDIKPNPKDYGLG